MHFWIDNCYETSLILKNERNHQKKNQNDLNPILCDTRDKEKEKFKDIEENEYAISLDRLWYFLVDVHTFDQYIIYLFLIIDQYITNII